MRHSKPHRRYLIYDTQYAVLRSPFSAECIALPSRQACILRTMHTVLYASLSLAVLKRLRENDEKIKFIIFLQTIRKIFSNVILWRLG
jgi:hypothetical protein